MWITPYQFHLFTDTPVVVSDEFGDDSKGWGGLEEDVLVGQEATEGLSDNNAEIILQLETEISELRQKIRAEQADKVKLNEELNAAKVKHGKLTLKVKQLSKELQTRKSSSPASASSGLGDDSLDKAIQVHFLNFSCYFLYFCNQ